MALYFPSAEALLLLTPKTGSTWIRDRVRALGLAVETVGDPAMRDHDLLASFDRDRYRIIGAFVRDPVEWYRSYWAYRMEKGWRPRYELDRQCRSDSFETFVRAAVTDMPGALGNIYESYIGPPDRPVDFIGRQETLAADLHRFLRLAGLGVAAADLDGRTPVNATRTRPPYPEELKELITLSEWDIMERLGYLAGRPDPIALAEIRDRYPDAADDLRLLALWTERIHWPPDDRKRAAGQPVPAATRHARAHSNFALFAQHKRHDLDHAEDRYRRACALDPRHPRTLCNYALFRWTRRDDPEQARQLMLRALHGRPDHPYTLGKLARLTDRVTGDPDLAELFYRQSAAGNPTQRDVRVELAGLLARRGRDGEAVDLLRAAAEAPDAGQLDLVALASLLVRLDPDAPETRRILRRTEGRADDEFPTPDATGASQQREAVR